MMPLRREKNSNHTHKTGSWYLLGVLSKLSHEHPRLFHMGFPPGGKGGFHRATVPQIPRWREPWDRDRKKLHKILTCGELRFWDDNDVLFWEIVFLLTPVHQACRERLSTRLANVSLPSRGSIWPNLTWALTKPGTIPENTVNVASRYVISRKRLFNPGVTVICVSPWYVYSRTHITVTPAGQRKIDRKIRLRQKLRPPKRSKRIASIATLDIVLSPGLLTVRYLFILSA